MTNSELFARIDELYEFKIHTLQMGNRYAKEIERAKHERHQVLASLSVLMKDAQPELTRKLDARMEKFSETCREFSKEIDKL